jgi:DNA mismatch repair protein MLH3
MPVRVRQRAIAAEKQGGFNKDLEELKRAIVMLLLAWTSTVTVILRETGTGQKTTLRTRPDSSSGRIDVLNVCNVLSQASYITPAELSSWVPVSASTSKLQIDGTISLKPSVTKRVQFISFGIHPLVIDGQSIIHDEINRLFSTSTFGNEANVHDSDTLGKVDGQEDTRPTGDGYRNKELKGNRKAIDRWPMFYINVQQTDMGRDLDIDDVLDNKANSLSAVIHLLKAMIVGFLTKYHFQTNIIGRQSRSKAEDSPDTTDKSTEKLSIAGAEVSRVPMRDSSRNNKIGKPPAKDVLGTNIKLPSFRRAGPGVESPFEAWSRVKKGSVTSKYGSIKDLNESNFAQGLGLDRPSSAPIRSTIESPPLSIRASTPELAQFAARKANPVLSSAGEIIRRPFEDIPAIKATPTSFGYSHGRKENGQAPGDEIEPWMNPVTKVISLVNNRTGLATSSTSNKRRECSRPSSIAKAKSQALSGSPSPWLASVLDKWINPVFEPAEPPIQRLSLGSRDVSVNMMQKALQRHGCYDSQLNAENAFKELPVETSGRISKDALRNAEVISQVDKKFILVKLRPSNYKDGAMLVIVDQHAADERIRIEELMQELCMPSQSGLSRDVDIQSIGLDKPLSYLVPSNEMRLFRTYQQHFTNWGVLYDLPTGITKDEAEDDKQESIVVSSLPPGIVERCKGSPRLLIELIRTEIWKLHDQGVHPRATAESKVAEHSWVSKARSCPQGIIDMLNSRACRSAIMFNDDLSTEQCKAIISRLAKCAFPFQCAHGRPSLIPLVDLGTMRTFSDAEGGEFLENLG